MKVERWQKIIITDLPDLQSVWQAVMEHVDSVARPSIEITPVSSLTIKVAEYSDEWVETFTVVIAGAPKDPEAGHAT